MCEMEPTAASSCACFFASSASAVAVVAMVLYAACRAAANASQRCGDVWTAEL
jgi:hypothetical protein